MKEIISLIVFFLCLATTLNYDQRDNYDQIVHYYEEYSCVPFLHIYYNHHFKNSKHFADFMDIIEETEYRNKDYTRFLFSDCDKIQQERSRACDQLKRTKDNHLILGFFPSGEFIKYGGKKMQNPPITKPYKRVSQNYRVEDFQNFLYQMIPSFYEEIKSLQQFEYWLQPKYTPNLIFATRQEDIPLVISQLGVNYFLRFDLGYLNDLTEKVVSQLNITTFPTLMVITYSFKNDTYELHKYPGKEFFPDNYDQIKAFLQPFALKEQRNDLLFHKIRSPEDKGIRTTDAVYELNQMLDRADGWALISEFKDKPAKLQSLKSKYGRYFEYFHFVNATQETEIISIFDPEKKKTTRLANEDVQWRVLPKTQFLQNTSALLSKNFIVMGVRQKYSHFCTLANFNFFRGLTYCFVLKEQDYEQTQVALSNKFQYGFVCHEILSKNGKKQVIGNNINSPNFQDVYYIAEYQTKMKSKEIVEQFYQNPVKSVEGIQTLAEICNLPNKKCALLFTHSAKKDRTAYDYLKEASKNFINDYIFFQIDLECNSQFQEEIQHIQKSGSTLIVYHPRQQTYIYLKAKLSRTTFERFLQANLEDNKKLPHRKWKTQNISVKSCKTQQKQKIEATTIELSELEEEEEEIVQL